MQALIIEKVKKFSNGMTIQIKRSNYCALCSLFILVDTLFANIKLFNKVQSCPQVVSIL